MNRVSSLPSRPASLVVAAMSILAFAVSARGDGTHLDAGETMKIRTTAYTAHEPQGGGATSAIGTRLRANSDICSAASDWSWLPVGTVFRMKQTGRTYKIEDYGSALVGRRTVDIYMSKNGDMSRWGVRQVDIEIVKMGCFEKSLAILKARQGSKHVRQMVAALRSRAAGVLASATTQSVPATDAQPAYAMLRTQSAEELPAATN